jgi:predicted MFS family arabinose efflux permease
MVSIPSGSIESGALDADAPAEATALSGRLTLLLAAAAGLIVANVYYSQPLAGPISVALGLSPQSAGLVVTMTQIGYALSLLLVAPLGDVLENRRLILGTMAVAALALGVAALSRHAAPFLAAAFAIGVGSVAVQILVPLAAHLAPMAQRGRAVGEVMSGVMLGIMLARPAASLIAYALSWHAVFWISAALTVVLAVVLRLTLPLRRPTMRLSYLALLRSMGALALRTPVLQRRALYHAAMFGAFSLFWTIVPLQLAEVFHLSQAGIALFALAGVAGAVSAPIAGRLADGGWTRPATALAMAAAAAAFLLGRLGLKATPMGLFALTATAILLDFGVTANLVLGQRAIFILGDEARSRLNGLYMATFFAGGAISSALGGWAYAHGGWSLTLWVGLALPLLAFAFYLTEVLPTGRTGVDRRR